MPYGALTAKQQEMLEEIRNETVPPTPTTRREHRTPTPHTTREHRTLPTIRLTMAETPEDPNANRRSSPEDLLKATDRPTPDTTRQDRIPTAPTTKEHRTPTPHTTRQHRTPHTTKHSTRHPRTRLFPYDDDENIVEVYISIYRPRHSRAPAHWDIFISDPSGRTPHTLHEVLPTPYISKHGRRRIKHVFASPKYNTRPSDRRDYHCSISIGEIEMEKVEEARGVIDRTDERAVGNSQQWCMDVRERLKEKWLLVEERGTKERLMRRLWRGR